MLPYTRLLPKHTLQLLVPAILVATLAFSAVAFVAPRTTFGATLTKVASCSVNLRSSPSGTARIRGVIKAGTKVTVVSQPTGTAYRTTCAGRAVSGSIWYRISAVNGRSTKSLYGVSYVYAARGLFASVPAPLTKYAQCAVNLRNSASTTGTVVRVLPAGGRVTVTTSVAGPSYQTTCVAKVASGSSW